MNIPYNKQNEKVRGVVEVKGYTYRKMHYIRVRGKLTLEEDILNYRNIDLDDKIDYVPIDKLEDLVSQKIDYIKRALKVNNCSVNEIDKNWYRINIYQ